MNAIEKLGDYLVYRDLKASTAEYYRRVVQVYVRANGVELDSRKLSEWLGDLRSKGKSDHYRRSLKNGLQAILRFNGDEGRIRPVKCAPLDHRFWNADEVRRLIEAAPDRWWKTIIGAGWCLGFSQCDLLALKRHNLHENGIVVTRRQKTGKLVSGQLEPWILEQMPATDPIWKYDRTKEWFRKQFRRICWKARLDGSFKQLRRSAAASVEARYREQAHRFLGNTRAVCEQHYLPQSLLAEHALRPEILREG